MKTLPLSKLLPLSARIACAALAFQSAARAEIFGIDTTTGKVMHGARNYFRRQRPAADSNIPRARRYLCRARA
jgi:hypothetical protein